MDKNIKSLIKNYQCPLINAFFFANDDMLLLESLLDETQSIRVLCKSTLTSFFDYNNNDYLTSFDLLEKYENDDYIVNVGEGSFGGDGVICVSNKNTKDLIWFLFLDNSNPFHSVKINNDCVIAKSTKNICFNIPILKPQGISIS